VRFPSNHSLNGYIGDAILCKRLPLNTKVLKHVYMTDITNRTLITAIQLRFGTAGSVPRFSTNTRGFNFHSYTQEKYRLSYLVRIAGRPNNE